MKPHPGHPYLRNLGYSVYRVHETEKRQFCWAHLLRNFRGLEEAGGKARSLGVAGQNIVKAIMAAAAVMRGEKEAAE